MERSRRTSQKAEVLETARRLDWLSASVDAVTGSGMNRFTACLSALEGLAKKLEAPIAVVGGLAAIRHGAQMTTLDADIAVPLDAVDRFLAEAPGFGLELKSRSQAGWHRFVFQHPEGAVEVYVIPEGARSPRDPPHAPSNPGPRDLGVSRGLGYAEFAPWVVMKLVAGRDKDRYHIVETLKHAAGSEIAGVVRRLRSLDPSYLQEFERLRREAEAERGRESW